MLHEVIYVLITANIYAQTVNKPLFLSVIFPRYHFPSGGYRHSNSSESPWSITTIQSWCIWT